MSNDEKLLQVLEKIEKKLDRLEPSGPKEVGLLTGEQLAQRWEVSIRKIQDMKSAGKIPFLMVDGSVRYKIRDIEAWEAKNTNKVSGY